MVIQNAIVCDIYGQKECDVRIENGIITELGKQLQDTEVLDAQGAYLLPALVDTNIQLLDSSLNAKNIAKLAQEAKQGGVGHIVLSPKTTPAIDDEIVLEFAQNGIKNITDVQVDVMLNTLKEDMTLSNIAIMLKKGVVAPFMSTIAKNNLAMKIAEYVKMYDVTLHVKAEDNSLFNAGVMLEGDVSSKLGLAGIPELSEVLHVSRMIEIARYYNIKIVFQSIASPRSVALITQAKKEGVAVSCEVSLHHLVACDEACEGFNTTAKLNPPLASKEGMTQLQNLLKEGAIDMLTTLHQPSSPLNKEVAFFDAAYGCEALSDAYALYYTKLVKSGLISMSTLVELAVKNPAQTIGYEKGEIKEGVVADVVLLNTQESYTIQNKQSLYDAQEVFGVLKQFVV
jgi:dihydroorotase